MTWFVEEVHVGSLDLAMASAVRNRRYEVALYLKQRGCPTLDEGLVSGAPDDALVWAAHNQILKENDAISRRLVAAFMRGVMVKAVLDKVSHQSALDARQSHQNKPRTLKLLVTSLNAVTQGLLDFTVKDFPP